MIKLSEKDVLKAKIGQKLYLFAKQPKWWMQRKSAWRKLKVQLEWTHGS